MRGIIRRFDSLADLTKRSKSSVKSKKSLFTNSSYNPRTFSFRRTARWTFNTIFLHYEFSKNSRRKGGIYKKRWPFVPISLGARVKISCGARHPAYFRGRDFRFWVVDPIKIMPTIFILNFFYSPPNKTYCIYPHRSFSMSLFTATILKINSLASGDHTVQ